MAAAEHAEEAGGQAYHADHMGAIFDEGFSFSGPPVARAREPSGASERRAGAARDAARSRKEAMGGVEDKRRRKAGRSVMSRTCR